VVREYAREAQWWLRTDWTERASGRLLRAGARAARQTFAEKVFARLQRSGCERFEARLAMAALVSRVVGVHRLLLVNFYPFLQRYLQPHQRDVTQLLAALVQARPRYLQPQPARRHAAAARRARAGAACSRTSVVVSRSWSPRSCRRARRAGRVGRCLASGACVRARPCCGSGAGAPHGWRAPGAQRPPAQAPPAANTLCSVLPWPYLFSYTQACHELVPPEALAPVLRQLVDAFVHDRARPEVMTLGLKTVRELCARAPLVMTEELLQARRAPAGVRGRAPGRRL